MTAQTRQAGEVAAVLRALLDRVASGDLPAGGARGAAMVRRLEGALLALEVTGRRQ